MTTEQELAKAKKLIQAKRYEDAKALLITIDHPTADKWLDRLNSLPAGQQEKVKNDATDKDFTAQVVISIFLLLFFFVPGLIALTIWKPQAERYPNAPGAKNILLLSKITTWGLRVLLAIVIVGAVWVVGTAMLSPSFISPF